MNTSLVWWLSMVSIGRDLSDLSAFLMSTRNRLSPSVFS